MPAPSSERQTDSWRRRLYVPHYHVGEAARYADISPQTVVAWHKATLSPKDDRESLSYMQLIEVAVVAAFRRAGVSLKEIQAARNYVRTKFKKEYPFAEYRFKSEGKNIWMDYEQIEGAKAKGTLLKANQAGQLAWESLLGRLSEFEYERKGIVVRWHVAGVSSPIVIDPRISFGSPSVGGTATWVIKGRWDAGESDSDIADDFGISRGDVRKALDFEGVGTGQWQNNLVVN